MSPPPVAAALDIGSNSVHLLVAQPAPGSGPVVVLDASQHTGIGRVVDDQGQLGEQGRALLIDLVTGLVDQARALGADPVVLMGTEPLRRAADAPALIDALRARTGLALVVLERTQEGLLTLLGVTGGRVDGPLAVIDIGGGSTEVTVVGPGRPPTVGVLPAGSARLAAAVVRHDPVTADEIEALRRSARQQATQLPPFRPSRAIVSGGSGTNVARLLGRPGAPRVDRAAIGEATELLQAQPAETLAARTGLTPRRIAQLSAGLALVEALLDQLGLETAEVSDASLREGALLATWAAGSEWLEALPELASGRGIG